MAYDETDRVRPAAQGAAGLPPTEPAAGDGVLQGDPALEREVGTALGFFRWAVDDEDETPPSDAHADYALRMSADLDVPAERLARMRERVFGARAAGPEAPSPAAHALGAASVQTTDRHPRPSHLARGAPAVAAAPTAPRPSFGRRCREMQRRIGEVAHELRVNDEVLLALEQGHARRVPRAFLSAAATFVDFDSSTLARCFAPNTGDVARMAAHDQTRRAPTVAAPDEFLAIIEDSELPEADKRYWREVVRAEDAAAGGATAGGAPHE